MCPNSLLSSGPKRYTTVTKTELAHSNTHIWHHRMQVAGQAHLWIHSNCIHVLPVGRGCANLCKHTETAQWTWHEWHCSQHTILSWRDCVDAGRDVLVSGCSAQNWLSQVCHTHKHSLAASHWRRTHSRRIDSAVYL
jgi:hypothetical protein